ncbi:MAG: hypothetical protein R2748_16180 [Bryobacterales bacterium]
MLWWTNGDGAIKGVPRDAFWSMGLYDSLILVMPSLDIVVARAGKSIGDGDWRGSDYGKLAPFFRPLVKATGAPYPQSEVILGVRWLAGDDRTQGQGRRQLAADLDGGRCAVHGLRRRLGLRATC